MMNSKKVFFFVGTIAELIKLFPIMVELKRRKIIYHIIASGQNSIEQSELLGTFDLGEAEIVLSTGGARKSAIDLFLWFFRTYRVGKRILKEYVRQGDVLLIHGDTVSTLMGARLGRRLGAKVMHVEAGLRSFDFFNPFPEEIDRVLATRYVDIAFCPNEWAMNNLAKNKKIEKVSTQYNTLVDALGLALTTKPESELLNKLLSVGKYFIFVMHRNENLADHAFVKAMVDLVVQSAKSIPCLFINHAVTELALEQQGLLGSLKDDHNIIMTRRLGYFEMMKVLDGCEFVLTDGGSNQEECFYLGKPCCVLRKATERIEGLDANVLLSRCELPQIERFVQNHQEYTRERVVPTVSPSKTIAQRVEIAIQG